MRFVQFQALTFFAAMTLFSNVLPYSVTVGEGAPNPKEKVKTFSASSAEVDGGEKRRFVDPGAYQILKEMGVYLNNTKSYSFHADVTFDEVLPTEMKVQFSKSLDIYVRQPNRMRIENRGDLATRRSWYDGKNVTVYDIGQNNYSVLKVPGDIDAALDHVMEKYDLSFPLADFLYQDPYATLIENVNSGHYVGLHDAQGVRSHHLIFSQDLIDWQIWIEDGKQMVPRKITITYKNLPGSPQYTAILSGWSFDLRLPDRLFIPNLPKDVEKIEFLSVVEREKSLRATVDVKGKGR